MPSVKVATKHRLMRPSAASGVNRPTISARPAISSTLGTNQRITFGNGMWSSLKVASRLVASLSLNCPEIAKNRPSAPRLRVWATSPKPTPEALRSTRVLRKVMGSLRWFRSGPPEARAADGGHKHGEGRKHHQDLHGSLRWF